MCEVALNTLTMCLESDTLATNHSAGTLKNYLVISRYFVLIFSTCTCLSHSGKWSSTQLQHPSLIWSLHWEPYEPIFLICSQKLGIRSLHLTLQKNSGHAGRGVVSHYICFGISYNSMIHDIQVNSMSQISDFTQQVGCNELLIVL